MDPGFNFLVALGVMFKSRMFWPWVVTCLGSGFSFLVPVSQVQIAYVQALVGNYLC